MKTCLAQLTIKICFVSRYCWNCPVDMCCIPSTSCSPCSLRPFPSSQVGCILMLLANMHAHSPSCTLRKYAVQLYRARLSSRELERKFLSPVHDWCTRVTRRLERLFTTSELVNTINMINTTWNAAMDMVVIGSICHICITLTLQKILHYL